MKKQPADISRAESVPRLSMPHVCETEEEIEMKQSSSYVRSDWNILAISHHLARIIGRLRKANLVLLRALQRELGSIQ